MILARGWYDKAAVSLVEDDLAGHGFGLRGGGGKLWEGSRYSIIVPTAIVTAEQGQEKTPPRSFLGGMVLGFSTRQYVSICP